VALVAFASYVIVRDELGRSIDKSLAHALAITRADAGHARTEHARLRQLLDRQSASRMVVPVELISATGSVERASDATTTIHPSARVVALARAGAGTYLFDANIKGTDYRVLAAGISPGYALVIDRSLAEDESTLSGLQLILFLLAVGGIVLAALLGRFVARTALAPVRRLTAAVEHVAATNDLGERIDATGRDELGRLAGAFNAMLAALNGTISALDESARAQRQLIADASHELRTPVTSLRTNIEILQHPADLPEPERTRLIADVVEQLEELSTLVSDLIELARDDEQFEPLEEVRLDMLVAEAIERAKLHAPEVRFETDLHESVVNAVPSRLGRAVNNLLDNAVKFAGTEEPIEISVHDGELEVRDHGPGIDPDELPLIFDRFFRGSHSRALPGSGLGLAIVRQVAERHAGTVSAAAAPGGGTIVRFRVPVAT
jgi:two-component system sensor histidine kinase MprB